MKPEAHGEIPAAVLYPVEYRVTAERRMGGDPVEVVVVLPRADLAGFLLREAEGLPGHLTALTVEVVRWG